MRQFVVVGHDAPTTGGFALDGLPGAGRVDLLARTVTAALLVSHGLREDVRVHLVCADEVTVRFEGATLQGLNPDERSTAARIRAALAEHEELVGRVPVEVSPGVSLVRGGLDAVLSDRAAEGTVLILHPDGEPAAGTTPPADPVFVCSDHRPFTDADLATVTEYADGRVSLGPRALHTDQAVVVAHNWCDTDGYRAGETAAPGEE